MKLQVVSDLHLSFSKFDLPETDADAILIAGDLDNGRKATNWLNRQYDRQQKPIYFVLGNHELYNKCLEEEADNWMGSFGGRNINLLDIRSQCWELIDENVLLIGSTMWTDFWKNDPASRHMSNYYMNDFHCIQTSRERPNGYTRSRFRAEDSYQEHLDTLEAFRDVRDNFWQDKYKLVIMTHHAPSLRSIHNRFKYDKEINGAYCSDLDDFMDEMRVHTWIHGHVHNSFDYETCGFGTRIVCNPRGYVGHENNNLFNPSLVIEV